MKFFLLSNIKWKKARYMIVYIVDCHLYKKEGGEYICIRLCMDTISLKNGNTWMTRVVATHVHFFICFVLNYGLPE